MVKLAVDDIGDCRGKRVLVRADFNVPLDQAGKITDDFRVQAALPTIRRVSESGGKVILMSHLGRPDGAEARLSLKPVAEVLSQALDKPVALAPDCVGAEVERLVVQMQDGDILLLENLRFHREENENDPEFAGRLAALGDIYINDAFASAHRVQASIVGITHHLEICAAGDLMQKEISAFIDVLTEPERPLVVVLGGDDFAEKKEFIDHLWERTDQFLVGGKICLPFLNAQGHDVGNWPGKEEQTKAAGEILARDEDKLVLPTDAFVSGEEEDQDLGIMQKGHRVVFFSVDLTPQVQELMQNIPEFVEQMQQPVVQLPPGESVADIGVGSGFKYYEIINAAKTVIWTGPMGDFDDPLFATGTKSVAGAMMLAVTVGAKAIVGGYDCLPMIDKFDLQKDSFSHISTGHRAFFECLKGRSLPGIEALS